MKHERFYLETPLILAKINGKHKYMCQCGFDGVVLGTEHADGDNGFLYFCSLYDSVFGTMSIAGALVIVQRRQGRSMGL